MCSMYKLLPHAESQGENGKAVQALSLMFLICKIARSV